MYIENNPFTPSFGRIPPYMAGRKMLLADITKAFKGNGNDPYLQTLIIGARGTGKTALLTRISEISSRNGWIAASVTCGNGMLEDIAQQAVSSSAHLIDISNSAKLKGITLGQLFGVEWEPANATQANWRMYMTGIIDKLAETGIGLCILVDEVRAGIEEMEQLASVFQHFVREGKRVALIMAGLPHQASQLVSSDAVSFLRRATLVSLGRIDDADITDAFQQTIESGGKSISDNALKECVYAIGGFPYMMQLVGFRSWDTSKEKSQIDIDDAKCGILLAQSDLQRQVLIPTWASLSNGDRAFCYSMARGNNNAKAIAADMHKKPNYVSKYKQRLLEQGVIEQDVYANLKFSLPGFKEFVEGSLVNA